MITLLNVDCMSYMDTVPDKHFDLAIVDPPYGIFSNKKNPSFNWLKEGSGGTWASKYGKKAKEWDNEPDGIYFQELERISKEQIIFGANHYGFKFDNYIIWKKKTISESFSMGMCEMASVSIKGNPKVFEHQPQDSERFHPCQKPIKLYKWLIEKYALPSFKIIDTHLGSGSSAIAAHYFGCDFVGCEIDKDYFDAAQKRFKQLTAQTTLL